MRKLPKVIQRRNEAVCRLVVEINKSLLDRLGDATKEFGMSKRDVVGEALLIWLNSQQSKKIPE